MLTIRLARIGKKNHPQFRIIVQERTKSPKGKFLECLGFYHPTTKKIECDTKKAEQFITNGAHVSPTVARLLKAQGVVGAEKYIVHVTPKLKKTEAESTAGTTATA